MSVARNIESLLFWAMALTGAAVVIPCLILPPWFEYRAAQEQLAVKQHYVAELENSLMRCKKQIEHHENDPAFILRLAQREFADIQLGGVQTVFIAPSAPIDDAPRTEPDAGAPREGDVVPEISAIVERLWTDYPQAALFARDATRIPMLILGGGLLLAAIVILGAPSIRSARERTQTRITAG